MNNKIGVCEWSLPVTGPTAVTMAAKAGFQGIQIGDLGGATQGYPMNSPAIQEAYLQAAEDGHIELQCLHPYALQREGTMLFPIDSPKGQQGKKDVEKCIDACADLHCYNIMLSSFFATKIENEYDFNVFAQQMKHACEYGADKGVLVTYESVLDPEDIFRLIEICGKNIKICYDTVNPIRRTAKYPVQQIPVLYDYIDHFHIKDMPDTMRGYAMLGEGTGQFKEAAEVIKSLGYDGWLISENYYSTLSYETGIDFIELCRKDIETTKKVFDIK